MTRRIGLDLLSLRGEWTGMAWQAWWLAHHMPRLAPDLHFVYFLPPGTDPPASGANVETISVGPGSHRGARLLAEQWHLPRAAGRARLDLLHTIAYGPPVLYRGVKLLTVHDLALWVMPEVAPARYRRYWRWAYGTAGRSCRRLIAVSECTKRDAVQFLHRRPDEIRVVQCGVDPACSPAMPLSDPGETVRRLGLPADYILNVGTLQPRKDLRTLLDSFSRLHAGRADLHLVIVGGRGWGYPDFEGMIRERGLSGAVHLAGFVPREALPDLYRAARLLLFTSRYEGFGLPPLEAMSCGTPVVATETSAIPEVVGPAALLAPAGDAEALAAAAERLLADPSLRAEMVRLGVERAAQFTWETTARKTLDVYRELLADARPH